MGTIINVNKLVEKCSKILEIEKEELLMQVLLGGKETIDLLLFIAQMEDGLNQEEPKIKKSEGIELLSKLKTIEDRLGVLEKEYGGPQNIPVEILSSILDEVKQLQSEIFGKKCNSDSSDLVDSLAFAMQAMNMEKPPIGVKPFYIHNEQRMVELQEAIERYNEANKEIPNEWVAELQSLEAWYNSYNQELKKEAFKKSEEENQVKIVVGKKGAGKTTEMIKASDATGATIVCFSETECDRVFEESKKMELEISKPVTIQKLMSKGFLPEKPEGFTILIDNIESVISNLLGGRFKLGAFSITDFRD